MKLIVIFISVIALMSCGNNSRRVHEKQRTPSDIKISSLDLQKKQIEIRFEYRTYVKKTLNAINCELTLNESNTIKLSKNSTIDLDAFSTEVIVFDEIDIPIIARTNIIGYAIQCEVSYNKGSEFINKNSVLHLVPASQSKYR